MINMIPIAIPPAWAKTTVPSKNSFKLAKRNSTLNQILENQYQSPHENVK